MCRYIHGQQKHKLLYYTRSLYNTMQCNKNPLQRFIGRYRGFNDNDNRGGYVVLCFIRFAAVCVRIGHNYSFPQIKDKEHTEFYIPIKSWQDDQEKESIELMEAKLTGQVFLYPAICNARR